MSAPESPQRRRGLRALLREPLLHFVLLGGAIFFVDDALAARRVDPHVIVVTPEVEAELRETFVRGQRREPSSAEMKSIRERWVDNEVLYREGLELRLEQGDTALRERVIFKALSIIESNVRVPPADDQTLRAWFEAHRTQYDIPARYDFSEAVVAGDKDEARLKAFVDVLERGTEGDFESSLRVFQGRPRSNVADSFGEPFAIALDAAPLDHWMLLTSREGPRVIRVNARTPGARATFEDVRANVRQDWVDAKAQSLRTAAVRELGKKYTVEVGGSRS